MDVQHMKGGPGHHTRAATTSNITRADDETTVIGAADITRVKALIAALRCPHPGPARRVLREPQRVLPQADFELLDEYQQDAWMRGDNWAASTGLFVPHQGGVRLVSLAEAGRWAA